MKRRKNWTNDLSGSQQRRGERRLAGARAADDADALDVPTTLYWGEEDILRLQETLATAADQGRTGRAATSLQLGCERAKKLRRVPGRRANARLRAVWPPLPLSAVCRGVLSLGGTLLSDLPPACDGRCSCVLVIFVTSEPR